MKVKAKDVIGSKIVIKDLNVGKVKEIVIDTDTGRVTHLEIELTKDAAEQAIGIKKGGIKNYLSVSAISGGQSDFRSGIIELKISTKQLRIYLSPTSE